MPPNPHPKFANAKEKVLRLYAIQALSLDTATKEAHAAHDHLEKWLKQVLTGLKATPPPANDAAVAGVIERLITERDDSAELWYYHEYQVTPKPKESKTHKPSNAFDDTFGDSHFGSSSHGMMPVATHGTMPFAPMPWQQPAQNLNYGLQQPMPALDYGLHTSQPQMHLNPFNPYEAPAGPSDYMTEEEVQHLAGLSPFTRPYPPHSDQSYHQQSLGRNSRRDQARRRGPRVFSWQRE
ncbi:hypothetical protein JCM10207_001348 [Rhodosporidiobolus poonsookiae]